jgi:hypothetical protein
LLSRRRFLNSTFGAGLAATSHQAAAQTPAVQPARKRLIVDAQVHVWKAESAGWRWIPGLKPQMPEPFTIEKLVPLMDEAGVASRRTSRAFATIMVSKQPSDILTASPSWAAPL